jgi:hypothetical protein
VAAVDVHERAARSNASAAIVATPRRPDVAAHLSVRDRDLGDEARRRHPRRAFGDDTGARLPVSLRRFGDAEERSIEAPPPAQSSSPHEKCHHSASNGANPAPVIAA